MPTITINIARAGTVGHDRSTSLGGHMWYTLDDGNGHTDSYGFYPLVEHGIKHSVGPEKMETAQPDDGYSWGRITYMSYEITQEQYEALNTFGKQPSQGWFCDLYFYECNRCISFHLQGDGKRLPQTKALD